MHAKLHYIIVYYCIHGVYNNIHVYASNIFFLHLILYSLFYFYIGIVEHHIINRI